MGLGESVDATLPHSFEELLTTDIQLNDPICASVLTSQILSHQVLRSQTIQELISRKPNNVQILVYHMIYSIYKISKTDKNSDFSKPLLISCFNSYLLLQHFHSFCIDSWFCWSPPSIIPGNLPSTFFVSSFNLLNHPIIQNSVQKNSIYFHIKYEMIACIIVFLLSTPQPTSDHFPNMHFECLDEADPFPLFKHILFTNYQKPTERPLTSNSSSNLQNASSNSNLVIPNSSNSPISINNDELHRIILIVAANGIAFCPNWQSSFASLNISTITPIFRGLLRNPDDNQIQLIDSPSPGIFHELISFFYQTLLRHDESLDSLVSTGKDYVVSLLLSLQLMNEKDILSYFHSLVFSTLVLLTSEPRISTSLNQPFTSNFPCKESVHRGNYADLLIEIVTNTVASNINSTAPLLPAACCILHNISAHITEFTYFSCHRIFRLLQLMAESRDRQVPNLLRIVVGSFEQIIWQQFNKNSNMLISIIKNMKVFKLAKQRGVESTFIDGFFKCFSEKVKALNVSKMGADEAEAVLKTLSPVMFMEGYELPGPRSHVFKGEMAELWIDWMRTLAMRGGDFQCLLSNSVL